MCRSPVWMRHSPGVGQIGWCLIRIRWNLPSSRQLILWWIASTAAGTAGNAGDDPLARLLPVGNQGGFRTHGSPAKDAVRLAVLYTSGAEPDWPDALDPYLRLRRAGSLRAGSAGTRLSWLCSDF